MRGRVLTPPASYRGLHRRSHSAGLWRFGALHPYLLWIRFAPAEHGQHAAPGNDQAGVVVGVIGMPAALADEPALAEPVVGMNVAACSTFLRAMVRRDDQEQNVVPGGLVFGIDADPPPCAVEDGPVESGLGSCAVAPAAARLVGFAL